MKDSIRHLIQQALTRLSAEGVLPEGLSPTIQVENTKDKSHGDFASNIAMMLAKPAGMKPRELAEKLIAALPDDAQISKVEIAGPGFLNFYQNSQALAERLDARKDLSWPAPPETEPPKARAHLVRLRERALGVPPRWRCPNVSDRLSLPVGQSCCFLHNEEWLCNSGNRLLRTPLSPSPLITEYVPLVIPRTI